MRDSGYATAGFGAGFVLAPATGIGSGFDTYDCPDDGGDDDLGDEDNA